MPIDAGNYGMVDIRSFGAKGDGSTDDSAAIQAAVDASENAPIASTYYRPIWFGYGNFKVTTGLTARSAAWIGAGPNVGTKITWAGGNTGTVITKSTDPGGTSFWMCDGMTLGRQDASNNPVTYFDFTSGAADVFLQLRRLQLIACSGDAIKTDGWTNFHLHHLRFDGIGGFGINLTPGASQNISSFVLDKFTYDNGATSGAKGLMIIDASVHNYTGNAGTVNVSNGRIECGTTLGGNKGFIEVKSGSSSNSLWVGLKIDSVTVDDSPAGETVVYSSGNRFVPGGAVASQPASLHLYNVRVNGVTAFLGGDWNNEVVTTVTGKPADGARFIGYNPQPAFNRDQLLTYGTTVNTNLSLGNICRLTVTDGVAFTMAKPTNMVEGQEVYYRFTNSSGGAMGAVTWNAAFKMEPFINPANTKRRMISFIYNKALDEFTQTGAQTGDA
jgi:hypothetical protein